MSSLTTCGKNGYGTRESCESSARHRSSITGTKLRVYLCATCRKWHMTKNKGGRSYRPRSQDSAACATTATTATTPPAMIVSNGHMATHATNASAGIASHLTA